MRRPIMKYFILLLVISFSSLLLANDPNLLTFDNYYDRNNQIVGQSSSAGFSIGYKYDGNGNMIRKLLLEEDSNHDGIPDIFQFIDGIDLGSTQNYFRDSDGDGWTDYQEIKAQSDPNNSSDQPWLAGNVGKILEATDSNTGVSLSEFAFSFIPSKYVMATGDLDGIIGDEIVLSADGDTGNHENYIYILSQTPHGWISEKVSVGDSGVTSLAIGNAGTGIKAIYAGLRSPEQYGSIIEIQKTNGSWTSHTLAQSLSEDAYVLGIQNETAVVVSLSQEEQIQGKIYSMKPVNNTWQLEMHDDRTGSIRGATVINTNANNPYIATARLLDNQIHIKDLPCDRELGESLAGYYPFDGNAFDATSNMADGVVTGAVLTADRHGDSNRAYIFGGNDNITVFNSGQFSFDYSKNDYSVSLWIMPSGGAGTIIIDQPSKSYEGYDCNMTLDDNNFIHAKIWDLSQEYDLTYNEPLAIGQWYHVAVVVKNKCGYLYVNGQEKSQKILGDEFSSKNNGNLLIGSGFNGKIDDLRIYSKALSMREILYLGENTQDRYVIPDTLTSAQIVPNSQYFAFVEIEKIIDTEPNYHYVSPDGNAPPDRQWSSVHTTIQPAIDVAKNGDVIIVNDGNYTTISIDKEINIQSVNGPNNTFIDGGSSARCVYMSKPATLEGLKIRNGFLSDNYAKGAGIYMTAGGNLINCIIESCQIQRSTGSVGGSYYLFGAGVCLDKGGYLRDCIIQNCSISGTPDRTGASFNGGGICSLNGGVFYNCTVRNNSLSAGGNGSSSHNATSGLIGGGVYANKKLSYFEELYSRQRRWLYVFLCIRSWLLCS